MSTNVKVVVRARPLQSQNSNSSSSSGSSGTKCILSMTPCSTTISLPPKQTSLYKSLDEDSFVTPSQKSFYFDKCYWSLPSTDSIPFSSQQDIFNDIGIDVLSNAFDGYNSCIFAYGQTGSGKSFSMMGDSNDPGLIPRISNALFQKSGSWDHPHESFSVKVSYLEIYNERVKDLLATKSNNNNNKSFRIREHPEQGPYVDGLSWHIVSSFADIEKLMILGNNARTVAETAMNDSSSRSHAIFTITLTRQKYEPELDLYHYRTSKINLVDLAGSERAAVSQTSGIRLKEGGSINKSLSSLGLVIKALTEKSKGKGKNVFVPYRDSVLTWLLRECLGGNSKTIMLATVSAADLHAEETLSTLRYADSAKNIVNKATVNEDPKAKIIQELLDEVNKLKEQLALTNGKQDNHEIEKYQLEITHLRHQLEEKENDIVNLKQQKRTSMSDNRFSSELSRKLSIDTSNYFSESDSERGRSMRELSKDFSNLPHLVNLNDDPMYSEVLVHYLSPGSTIIGSDPSCSILLKGEFVESSHCIIEVMENNVVFISPSTSKIKSLSPLDEDLLRMLPDHSSLDGYDGNMIQLPILYVNGEKISSKIRLKHGSRVLIGRSHLFKFNHPQEAYVLRQKRISEISSQDDSRRTSSFSEYSSDASPPKQSKRYSNHGAREDNNHRESTFSLNDNENEENIAAGSPRRQMAFQTEYQQSEIEITIPHVEYIEDEKPYHIYHVYVTIKGQCSSSWHVARRYSQFLSFYKQILAKCPSMISNIFPSNSVTDNLINLVATPSKLLDKRRSRLEMYLNAVVKWWFSEWIFERRLIDEEVVQKQIPLLCPNGVLDAYTGIWIHLEKKTLEEERKYSMEDETIQLPDLSFRK